MSKKSVIVVLLILILVVIFWGYPKFIKPRYERYQTAKEFIFEVKNKDLSSAAVEIYRQQFNEAVAQVKDNSLSINPWNRLGVIKKIIGDLEGAERAWLRAGEINPKNSLSFGNLGDLYGFVWHDFAKAEKMFLRAIVNEPGEQNWYVQLNTVYRDWPEKKDLAKKILLQGLTAIPDSPNLVALLAEAYKEAGEKEKAIEYYEKLIKLSPDNQAAKEDLAKLKDGK